MSILQSIIFAIVEGLTEFLPVSSTAHLVLTSQILGIVQSEFVKSFEIIIQLGAILAVVVLYFRELLINKKLWVSIIVAFLPSAVLGLFLYDFIKKQLIGNGLVTALALIIGGLAFMAIDKLLSNKAKSSQTLIKDLGIKKLLSIGLFQCLAMIPGVSRSASSIFGGILTGLNKAEATKFSFFLAIPTMLAATTLDLYKSELSFSQQETTILLVGFVGSFVTALFAIKAFIKFVQKHSFTSFGLYRVIVGLYWLFVIIKI